MREYICVDPLFPDYKFYLFESEARAGAVGAGEGQDAVGSHVGNFGAELFSGCEMVSRPVGYVAVSVQPVAAV